MFVLVAAVGVHAGRAQSIHVDAESVPLEEALLTLREQAEVNIVFAQRLVEGHIVTCRYQGQNPADALACLLRGTGLQAQRVRSQQYVLIAEAPVSSEDEQQTSQRGMLYGFVSDAETGEVLPGAHIYLPDLKQGATTNEAGYYSIPALRRVSFRVRISYLGYRTQDTVLVAGGRSARIALVPMTVEGESIIVEGRRSSQTDLSAIPGLVNVPVQQFEKLPSFLGGKDLLQALQWLPGVRRSGEISGGLTILGASSDQNLYLLDGAPVYHPWHAFSLVSTFQTETFKDIKLYRGSFPAEHGGRLSAVLDAEMKDGSRAGPRAIAALGVLSGRFLIESPLTRNSSFMLAGRRSFLDKITGREHPVKDADGRRDTLRTGYYFYDVSAKLTYRTSVRHRFSLSYYHGRDNLDLRLPFDFSLDFSSWLRPADLFFEVGHNWENQLVSARYQFLQSRRFFVSTTAYYSGYRAQENSLFQPTSRTTLASDYRVRLYDVGIKADADYYHSLEHQVRAGVHLVTHQFRSSLDAALQFSPGAVDSTAQRSRLQATEAAVYVQDVWQPDARWQFQPGLRASYFSGGDYFRLSPRFNIRYTVAPERLVLRGAAGLHVQYMQRLRDRYSFLYDLVSSRWIPTSMQVRPTTSRQAALGAELYPRSWLTLTVEGYWRSSENTLLPEDVFRIKDGLVGPGIEVGTLLLQYTPAEARAYGLSIALRLEQGPWQVWLSYAGGRSLSRAPALNEQQYRPTRFDVPRALRAVVDRTGARWSFAVSTELRSGFPNTVPVARYSLGDALDDEPVHYLHRPQVNNGRLPPYFRIDLAMAYRFEWLAAQWQVQAQLYNALNRRNVVERRYEPVEQGVRIDDRRSLPIIPLVELELTL